MRYFESKESSVELLRGAGRNLATQERWQKQIRSLLDELARDATAAEDETAGFCKLLGLRQAQISAATTLGEATQVIVRLLEETQRAQSLSCALSQRLSTRAEQVEVLAQRLEQIQVEALIDPLCGLENRRGFERAVTEVFASGSAGSVALLLADVDRFKQLNDTYGHLLGDRVLRAIAHTMRASIKGKDVAARYGGDEFSLLLPQTTIHDAKAVAEQIRASVATGRIRRLDGQLLRRDVTLSIGVATGDTTEGFEALMARADAALYRAKRSGRNRVCLAVA